MPPKGLQGFVDSKLVSSSSDKADPRPSPKAPLTKEQARQNGFYIDPNARRLASPEPRNTSQDVAKGERKSSPLVHAPVPLRNNGAYDQYHGFDTDASLRDDLSGYDDGEDTISFRSPVPTQHRLGFSGFNDRTRRETIVYPPPQAAAVRAMDYSSYPPTTASGSQSGYEPSEQGPAPTAAAHQGFKFQTRPLENTVRPRHNPPPQSSSANIPSTRATVAQSPRSPQPSRLTIVREPAPQQPLLSRLRDIPFVRPNTSRPTEPTHAPAPMETVTASHFAKNSSQGDVSDVDSSPPSTHYGEDELDYSPAELRGKHFAELQRESVDKTSLGASPISMDDLPARLLSALHSGSKEQQLALLESLDIGKWEQAGDWFVEQMADVIKRFVQIRKEKRQLAMQLEREIEARHDLVNEKRQVLQENLAGLREAGHRVLAVGTPKKRARQG